VGFLIGIDLASASLPPFSTTECVLGERVLDTILANIPMSWCNVFN